MTTEPVLTAAAMTADDDAVVIVPARTWDALDVAARRNGGIPFMDEAWARRGLQNLVMWPASDYGGRYIIVIRGES
jgi:hypothetical protein